MAAVLVGHLLAPVVPAAAAGAGVLTPYDLAKLYHSCFSSFSCCCSSANCSAANRRSLRHLNRHTRYTAAVAHIHTYSSSGGSSSQAAVMQQTPDKDTAGIHLLCSHTHSVPPGPGGGDGVGAAVAAVVLRCWPGVLWGLPAVST